MLLIFLYYKTRFAKPGLHLKPSANRAFFTPQPVKRIAECTEVSTYEPRLNMSAIQATSAQYRIWLDYFRRIGVNEDDITTIPKPLIKGRIAVLSADRMQQIEDAIRFAIDLP